MGLPGLAAPVPPALRAAPYVLRALLVDQRRGETGGRTLVHLDALALEVGGERGAVRAAVSMLHRLRLVDALRNQLTPAGRVVASLVEVGRLPPLDWVAS